MDTCYAKDRHEWRDWLEKNHDKLSEVWLVRYKKATGKPCVLYDESVEEALCFGWIDGVVKRNDEESVIQRFTPRRKNSNWSELNKERARRLIKSGKMTPAGMRALDGVDLKKYPLKLTKEIETVLKSDKEVWENFQNFDDTYKTIRIAYIMDAHKQKRFDDYERRLNSFVRATKKNRRIGTKI